MSNLNQVPRFPLTCVGGKWEVSAALRQLLCLTDDGVLHIVDGYEGDHFVFGFQELIRRNGVKFTISTVTPEQLNALYNGTSGKTYQHKDIGRGDIHEQSQRQQEVIQIILSATQSGASDIHFFPTPNGHQLKFRIHGELELIKNFVGEHGKLLQGTIYGSMCQSNSVDTNYRPETAQGGRLRSDFVNQSGLFGARIATRPTINGPWMAMRLLYDSGKFIPLDDMGYLDDQIATLKRLNNLTYGIILFSGPTGSGKSTALQTMLSMLMSENKGMNLSTVEDPVEYRIEGAQQTPLTGAWVDAITNLMRMDPDALMFGEIRDLLSALAAFQGANTGHLMYSTLHTSSAAGCVQRLHDLGVENSLLLDPSMMQGLINQSLARIICPKCRVPYLEGRSDVSLDLRQRIESLCIPEHVFLKGKGCSHCSNRGVVGRTAIAEVIQPDLGFMRVFRDKGKAEAQAWWVHERGGTTKSAHLIQRINEGLLDPAQAERDVCQIDDNLRTVESQ